MVTQIQQAGSPHELASSMENICICICIYICICICMFICICIHNSNTTSRVPTWARQLNGKYQGLNIFCIFSSLQFWFEYQYQFVHKNAKRNAPICVCPMFVEIFVQYLLTYFPTLPWCSYSASFPSVGFLLVGPWWPLLVRKVSKSNSCHGETLCGEKMKLNMN